MQLLQCLAVQVRVILDLPLKAVTGAGDTDLIPMPADLDPGLSATSMIGRPLRERGDAVNRDRQSHLTRRYRLPADLLCCGDLYPERFCRCLALCLLRLCLADCCAA